MMEKFKTVIIIGMGRSGTSLTASLLQKSGLDIGKKLLGASIGNTEGHYENVDFLDFHMNVLQELNYNPDGWDLVEIKQAEQYEEEAKKIIQDNQSSLWGWKEPRTTLFINFWAKLLPEAHFLFVYRSPVEVVDSLLRRGSDPVIMDDPEKSIDAWLHYNKLILNTFAKFKDRSFLVDIKFLISNYPAFINAINKKFNIYLNPDIEHLFDKSLFKEYSKKQERTTKLLYKNKPEALEIYNELINQSWTPDNTRELQKIDLSDDRNQLFKEYFFEQWKKHCELESQLKRLTTVQIPLILKERDSEINEKMNIIHEKESLIYQQGLSILSLEKEIDWMKKSKFWTMRKTWQKLKSASINMYSHFF